MARVRAYMAFDSDSFDLNEIVEESDSFDFFNDQPRTLGGVSCQGQGPVPVR